MTRNKAHADFTADLFDTFITRTEWAGGGYLRERMFHLMPGSDPEFTPGDVERSDALALRIATEKGWTVEQLFTWANSKNGRWFADVTLGSDEFGPMAENLVVLR